MHILICFLAVLLFQTVALQPAEAQQAEPRPDAYQRVGDQQPESIKGGHVQGPTQAPTQAPAAQCGPGCGQAKAYYQPRRGVRSFGSCGGGRRFALLPRNRR